MSPPVLRVTYARFSELRDDIEQQMAYGGVVVKIAETADLQRDAPVALELVLPDGAVVAAAARVLQILGGLGVAVSLGADAVADLRGRAAGADPSDAAPAIHERFDGPAPPPTAPRSAASTSPPARRELGEPSHADKIHKAIHGSRDERNAILRDKNRSLYPYVLKNPQLTVDDVLAIAKNAQMTPEILKQIAERKEWLTRPAVATALARNPKTPPEVAVRALEFVPVDGLRTMARGGVLPHVSQAARKRLLR
jgi:hypothetical protein